MEEGEILPSGDPVSVSSTPFSMTPSVLLEYTPLSKPYGIEMSTTLDSTQFANLQTSAESGSSDSSYFLGLAHLYGLANQKASPVKAFRYFRSAASQGHGDAMCAIGILLYYGWGVGRDTKGAIAWFNAASEHDEARGHWLLGRAYYEGRVSKEPNFEEAGRLFGLAAEVGVGEAKYHLGVMFEYGLISDKRETGKVRLDEERRTAGLRVGAKPQLELHLTYFPLASLANPLLIAG